MLVVRRRWTRADVLALLGLIATAIGVAAAVLAIPGMPKVFHCDPASTSAEADVPISGPDHHPNTPRPRGRNTTLPIPPVVKTGAPIGTRYEYTYEHWSGQTCRGDYVKISRSEWYEQHPPGEPHPCTVNAMIRSFSEREPDDPSYFFLYDAERRQSIRLANTPVGVESALEVRTPSGEDWSVNRVVTREK